MPLTPREVAEKLIHAVPNQDWDGLPDLYAPDATVELPFQLPAPERIVGRRALAEHFNRAGKMPLRLTAENIHVHETTDEEVVIAEFDYLGENTLTGARFNFPNVFVIRVREGLIVRSRDYSNHAILAAAFDRIEDVASRIELDPARAGQASPARESKQ